MVNVCGKVVVERQHLSQLYECRVVRKARVIVDNNSHVIAKYYELFPSGRRFRVLKSNTVNSISEQMKPFGCQSSVCVCVCVWVCVMCDVCSLTASWHRVVCRLSQNVVTKWKSQGWSCRVKMVG